jgi:DNA-3-methyladenine glycosylase
MKTRQIQILSRSFFDRDAQQVAQALLGKVLHVRYQQIWLTAMIIETEAYYLHDKASHASLGYTPKRSALFMPAGTIYMYYARGGDSLNISCQGPGNAVLLKSGVIFEDETTVASMSAIMQQLNPLASKDRSLAKLCSGQTLLCRSLNLKVPDWDQKTFDSKKFFIADHGIFPEKIIQARRLGIRADRDPHYLLRFIDYHYADRATQNPLKAKSWKLGVDYIIKHGSQSAC